MRFEIGLEFLRSVETRRLKSSYAAYRSVIGLCNSRVFSASFVAVAYHLWRSSYQSDDTSAAPAVATIA